MLIQEVPKEFQPIYRSSYPGYSSGKNMEEILYEMIMKNKDTIKTDYVYLPVFWTSYYVTHNYGSDINKIYNWLETLDKTKKYFTIVQYAAGIFVKNNNLSILVFTGGGGGINIKGPNCITDATYFGLQRQLFIGNKGDIDLPLICMPQFPSIDMKKDIYCSFMGRFDTHYCRIEMKNALENIDNIKFHESVNFETYKTILNRSIFTLAPRGYGYTSFRIYEAILCGSIPIYIWHDKKILPFNDILEWEKFSFIVHSSEVHKIPQLLKSANIKEMQSKLAEVQKYFLFDETYNYIKGKLIC